MNIYEKTESVLALFFNSYFHGMPDFGEGQEPLRYAVYTVVHKPEHFVSGRKTADSYFIMLSIFTPLLDPTLYTEIEEAFTDEGYTFQQGRQVDFRDEFPQKTHYSMDFIISIDV